ncbi:MAG: hypothetical protein FWE09_08110, partial [Treponema sp.]|nr:hypothetical protein [Treponema sp.]
AAIARAALWAMLCLPLWGCGNPAQEAPAGPRVRADFRHNGSGAIQARVFIEGPNGNAVSAAVVTVRDARNAVTHLDYAPSSLSYSGIIEEPEGYSVYTVEVSTILSPEVIRLEVPYSRPVGAPHVTVFQDSAGNSVLNGQQLDSSKAVQIGWADGGEGATYRVAIRTALKTVYAVTTQARTVTLPANAIPTGSYLLEIVAQNTYGDVYFRDAPYYSASSVQAPLVSCNVN